MFILVIIAALGMLACWIMVLIKMFKNENIGLSILGILCWLWAFIWGWMNAKKHGLQKIMMIWTICAVLYFVFAGASGMFSGNFSYSTP